MAEFMKPEFLLSMQGEEGEPAVETLKTPTARLDHPSHATVYPRSSMKQ